MSGKNRYNTPSRVVIESPMLVSLGTKTTTEKKSTKPVLQKQEVRYGGNWVRLCLYPPKALCQPHNTDSNRLREDPETSAAMNTVALLFLTTAILYVMQTLAAHKTLQHR